MHVASLHLYPLKSARVIDLTSAELEPRGLAGDRCWLIVDETGLFLTQREEPRLACLTVKLTGAGLMLSAPDQPALVVPCPGDGAAVLNVEVWRDKVQARLAPEATAWLTAWLGRPFHLVWLPDHWSRPTSAEWTPGGGNVGFADGFPILITNTASLADLNQRLSEPVPMNRFRPNIVIDASEPWAEDVWHIVRIGDTELELVKPCTRCVMTTTDQITGNRPGHEPLRTLQRMRKSAEPRVTGALFGWNAVPRRLGTIRVGDPAEVLSRREPWPIKAPR